jgi:hypothetical protein
MLQEDERGSGGRNEQGRSQVKVPYAKREDQLIEGLLDPKVDVSACVNSSKRQVSLGGQPGTCQQRQDQRKPRQPSALERSSRKRVQRADFREA